MKIGEVKCNCLSCDWEGTVDDCYPDVDGDGSLGCPACLYWVRTELDPPPAMKYWQHDETGIVTAKDESIGPRWYEITKEQYERYVITNNRNAKP